MDHQFQSPGHGSRYAPDGTVEREPAEHLLPIVHVAIENEANWLTPWPEPAPRPGEMPW